MPPYFYIPHIICLCVVIVVPIRTHSDGDITILLYLKMTVKKLSCKITTVILKYTSRNCASSEILMNHHPPRICKRFQSNNM